MSRSADKLFSFLDEKERFFVAMSVIRPDFVELPDWTQEMAFTEYCNVIEEVKMQFKDTGELNISDEDLSRGIWHSSNVDRYYGEAAAGMKLGEALISHHERLQTAQDLDQLLVGEYRYCSNNIGAHTVQYCVDVDCNIPFLTATFDEQGKTIQLSTYDFPIDLTSGEVAPAKPDSRAEQLKPTAKQLNYAKQLAAQAGVDLPYFNTRRAAGAFIHKYAPTRNGMMTERIGQAQEEAAHRASETKPPPKTEIER